MNDNTKAIYDDAQFKRWLQIENSLLHQKFMKYTIEHWLPEDLSGKTAYDVAFGTGFCMKIMLNKGIKFYTGLDASDGMLNYINNLISENGWINKVKLVFDTSYNYNLLHNNGPFDILTSVGGIHYAQKYSELLDTCKHLFNNTKKEGGVLFVMAFSYDFLHTKETISTLKRFGTVLEPQLKECEKYTEFSQITIKLLKPAFLTDIIHENEPVVGQHTIKKALKEAGYKTVESLDFVAEPGYEYFLNYAKAFNMMYYKCTC